MAVRKVRTEKQAKMKTAKKESVEKFLKIKLVRSLIGRPEKQREVVKGLGLRKLQSEVIRRDCLEVWGMIRKVQHLVKVEEMERK